MQLLLLTRRASVNDYDDYTALPALGQALFYNVTVPHTCLPQVIPEKIFYIEA